MRTNDVDDEQLLRAEQLRQAGLATVAEMIENCGVLAFNGVKHKTISCKDRSCPRCQRIRQHKHARRITTALRAMVCPVHVILHMPIRRRGDSLRAALKDARATLTKLHRSAPLKGRAVAGAVEIAILPFGYDVHVHLAIDSIGDDELEKLSHHWRAQTGGLLKVDREVEDSTRFGNYISKATGWSSPVDGSPFDLLAVRRATWNFRRGIVWKEAGEPANDTESTRVDA